MIKKTKYISKFLTATALVVPLVFAQVSAKPSDKSKRIIEHWTPERIQNATPRDLVIDNKGLGYIRGRDGALIRHGSGKPIPMMGPPGGGGTEPPAPAHVVTNSGWSNGGLILQTAGRLLYEMPTNKRGTRWGAFVCSGTVVNDGATGRSVIITAAHCVFEDVSKKFARNVLFIPNQDGTTGSGTDTNCSNDPVGCWTPSFGVVDVNWTTRSFPDNIPWDYAYYVVSDSGAHSGASASSNSLDTAVGSIDISFNQPVLDDGDASDTSPDYTHGLGYSFSEDPNFMYCAEDMTPEAGGDNWWLANCGLSGGSSGGPWIQPMDTTDGTGPLISVNSWGFTNQPGMAGPKLSGTSAECIFSEAKSITFGSVPTSDGNEGVAVDFCF